MNKLADVQRKLLALHHKKNPKVEMKPSPLIPDEDSMPPPPPQPSPAPVARHRNRLWDQQFSRPSEQAPAPASLIRSFAPTERKFTKPIKAHVQAKKPPVHALLSHNVNQDTTAPSLDALASAKISIP